MCYNAITGSAPSYLSELLVLHLYSPSRSLHSSSDTRILKLQSFNRKTHGFYTFSHFGPHIWNNLPQYIKHYATLSTFKSKLKTFLRVFQLSNTVLYSITSISNKVCTVIYVCVCVCVCVCVWVGVWVCGWVGACVCVSFTYLPTLVDVYIIRQLSAKLLITFSVSMYVKCVIIYHVCSVL